jgi:hypothetical protein
MASMTKRDFNNLSGIARVEWKEQLGLTADQYSQICLDLAYFCQGTNKRFDREQFLRSCQI